MGDRSLRHTVHYAIGYPTAEYRTREFTTQDFTADIEPVYAGDTLKTDREIMDIGTLRILKSS